MKNLLKSLHYVSMGLAEVRLNLYDAMLTHPDNLWQNIETELAGANATIETALAQMYNIEELAETKEKHDGNS